MVGQWDGDSDIVLKSGPYLVPVDRGKWNFPFAKVLFWQGKFHLLKVGKFCDTRPVSQQYSSRRSTVIGATPVDIFSFVKIFAINVAFGQL